MQLTDNFIKSTLKAVGAKIPSKILDIKSEFSLDRINYDYKYVRLDIYAEYAEQIVSIEMQNKDNFNIYERTRYYYSKLCATQLNRGDEYTKLKPVTMITILNYIPKDAHTSKCMEHLVVVEDNNRKQDVDMGIKFIYIFLPRLKNIKSLDYNEPFVQWLKFLEYKDEEVIKMICEKNSTIKKANYVVKGISAEEEERRYQRAVEEGELDLIFARTRGFDDGKKIGLASGRKEGIITGRLETLVGIVKQMTSKNYPISEIQELTGLSNEEIQKLAKSV